MAGLVPAIHDFARPSPLPREKVVGGRDKPGHDGTTYRDTTWRSQGFFALASGNGRMFDVAARP